MRKNGLMKGVRKITSVLLTVGFVITGIPTGGLMTRATVLTPNTSLNTASDTVSKVGDYTFGSTDATAYTFGPGESATNAYYYRADRPNQYIFEWNNHSTFKTFNIAAVLKDSDRENNTKGYLENNYTSGRLVGSKVKTAYDQGYISGFNSWGAFNSWNTYYGFGKPRADYGVNNPALAGSEPNALDPGVVTYIGKKPDTATIYGGSDYSPSPALTGSNLKLYKPSANGSVETLVDGTKKVEVRQEVKPSDDGESILVQYTVYNAGTSNVDFMIGNESDTMLYNHDGSPIIVNGSDRLHMIANAGNTYEFSTFDVKAEGSDVRVWAGEWDSTAGLSSTFWTFAKQRDVFLQGLDSAAAFSAHFNLNAGEVDTATFYISMKTSVYYVDPSYNDANGSSNGYITRPFKTIQDAVNAIAGNHPYRAGVRTRDTEETSAPQRAYIYLMGDVEQKSAITVPNGLNLTIQTTDFNSPGATNYSDEYNDVGSLTRYTSSSKTIKRYAGDGTASNPAYTGELFNITGTNSTLTLTDIVVDGNGSLVKAKAPLIKTGGSGNKVNIRNNTVLQNNQIAETTTSENTKDIPAAINIVGDTLLSMDSKLGASASGSDNGVVVANNISGEESSAISLKDATATHPMSINKDVTIESNTANDSGKANVYLYDKYLWLKKGSEFTGNIGVNVKTDRLPKTNEEGTAIVDFEGRTSNSLLPFSAVNFSADKMGQLIKQGISSNPITEHTAFNNETNQIDKVAYLYATQYDFSIVYVDENDAAIPFANLDFSGSAPNEHVDANPFTKTLAGGTELNYKMPIVAGYIFKTTNPDPLPNSISIDSTGNITGTLPTSNTDITVKLKKNEVRYKFDVKGGVEIQDKFEGVTLGSSTLGKFPTPTRLGYDFVQWNSYDDTNGNKTFDTGETDNGFFAHAEDNFPAPSTAKIVNLYAVWTPGTTKYPLQITHRNTNVALPLTLGIDTSEHTIASAVTKNHENIPGYRYNNATRTPVQYGTLNTTTGQFDVNMPAVGINLNYGYSVDPNQTFTYTVKHQDFGGNDLINPVITQRRAEQDINAMPETSLVGYIYNTFTIDEGYDSDNATNSRHYIVGLDNENLMITNDTASGTFQAKMPNQNVTVVFKYESDGESNIVRRFFDRITDKIVATQVNKVAPGSLINVGIPTSGSITGDKLYGYFWDLNSSAIVVPPTAASINPTSGQLTGAMPLTGNGVRADYKLSRNEKWRDINFAVANAPYENGSINPLPADAPTSFLANDGTAAGNTNAYNFSKLKADGYIPTPTANRYYMFEGWYKDSAATQPVNDSDTFETSTTPLTLYAKFVEDPSQWIDINFTAGTNGAIGTPNTLHKPYDYTWGQILTDLPSTIPVANYVFSNWSAPDNNVMNNSSLLVNHATYRANFIKDANTWGLGVGAIEPAGRIGADGSGEIVIHGTTPNNVYVVTDKNGKIVAVVKGKDGGSITTVEDMIPGAHYDVYEGTPDTQAQVGNDASTITGSAVSTPKDVYIPTVENNYNVGYDPNNDGMAQIVINPADPDADYALIDEAGNVLKYPGSDNGWLTPIGSSPSTVTFDNLNPNETYTVVARKKKDSSLPDPLMKIADGNKITANPGDMADAVKYTIETINGSIVSVGDTSVNADTYTEAKANQEVKISAPAVNAQGKRFLHWNVLAGRAVGVSGNITESDYSFKLSNSNIVLKAVYEPVKVAGDDADVIEEIRGGDLGEFGLDPRIIPDLEHELTTPLDRSLIGVNGAKVDYRVVFNKRDSKQVEKSAVKPLSNSGRLHEDAFTAAYSLDILLERYVDGRKVDRATSSNAEVDVIAQLPARDVDQLDYQIYDVTPDRVTGAINPTEVNISTDVANNAGLLKFKGNVTHTYILVYSKTFKTVFVDNKPVLEHLFLNDTSRNFYHSFKVRRKEAVEDSYYTSDYNIVTAYAKNDVAGSIKTPFEDIYGVEYNYVNWSTKEDTLKVYDTTSPVTRRTVIYAYYRNNRPEVLKARDDLSNTIEEARNLVRDPYLKLGEVERVNKQIDIAVEILRKARDLVNIFDSDETYLRQAIYKELQREIDALRELIDNYNKLIEQRKNRRNATTGGETSGGTTSSGRGSKLLAPGEKSTAKGARLEASNVRAFVLGTDGKWTKNPPTGGWSGTLEGGLPLNNIWGSITYKDESGKDVTRWYFFNSDSTMVTGWHFDTSSNKWFYLNPKAGDKQGQMQTGWVKDETTGKWYFMNLESGALSIGWAKAPDNRWYLFDESGAMLTGWRNVNEKWYYLNPNTNNDRPFGSMYINETTPDGYRVDESGAWIK